MKDASSFSGQRSTPVIVGWYMSRTCKNIS